MREFRFKARQRGFLGSAAAIVGIGAGLSSMGLFGGGGAPSSSSYSYANPAIAGYANDLWSQNLGLSQGNNQIYRNMTQGPLLAALQQGLGTTAPGTAALPGQLSSAYGNIVDANSLYAGLLGGAGGDALTSLYNAGKQTYNTSLDPQNALHDQLLHQVLEQSRAGQSARGIAMSGVGQGLDDDATRKFETGWSNELLGRQTQGLTAMEQALGAGSQIAGNNFTGASNLYGQVPGALTGAASAPYTAAGINANWLTSLLGGLGGAYQQNVIAPGQQIQNQIIPYLNAGNGAGANAFNGAMAGYAANQSNQQYGLNSTLSGLSQFGKSPGGQATGNWLNSMWGSGGYTSPQYNPSNTGGQTWTP